MAIQRQPFEWMVRPTPQREWIEGRGMLLWLAFFWGMGAGLYLVSLYFGSLWGMLFGWTIVIAGKGGFHMAYLGKPMRFWRAVRRPGSSWLSRGIIILIAFFVFGAIQMALSKWQPGTAEAVFKVLAGMAAFSAAIYTGFLLSYVRAVPFWNSTMLPVLFALYAILGGSGIALAMGLGWDNTIRTADLEWGVRGMLAAGVVMLIVYLWSTSYSVRGSKDAVMALIRGPKSFSLPFWVGLVVVGITIPLVIVWYSWANDVSTSWLYFGIACEFIGGLALRYSILKAGVYPTLLPI